MNRAKATKIAEHFISNMNPDKWDGVGTEPTSFNKLICTYDINSQNGNELDISFDWDEEDGAWTHYCELRDKLSGDLITPLHGYGVDSVPNLVDTILDICQGE